MVTILGFGLLFGVIGFGLGLLASYAEKKRDTQHEVNNKPILVQLDKESAIQAWIPVYTQAAETFRQSIKMLVGANAAGLAACFAAVK